MSRLCLIDLSGIFRAAWHASEHEEVSAAFNRTVSTVTTASAGYDHVAICVDRPPYKRKEIFPQYKAHREAAPAAMYEQLRAIVEQLDADGYHIVGADGYEADDIIGALAQWARSESHQADIYSSDKDMLQLVGDGVAVVSTATRQRYETADCVKAKLGVTPDLVADWLALVGDKADGIPGVPGVGPKTAATWLTEIGPLESILMHTEKLPERFRDSVAKSVDSIALSWRLAQLMTDAPITPEKILMDKPRKDAPEQDTVAIEDEPEIVNTSDEKLHGATVVEMARVATAEKPQTAMVQATGDGPSWDRALEPRTPGQAWGVANALYKSRLFGDFPNPEAILAIVMTGRSLGMDTVASLRGFHVIKGKPSMSAQLIVGVVKRSHLCEYFRLVSSTEGSASWETKRRDEPEPTRMTYTFEDAQRAGLLGNDQWKKRPTTMLRWRAATELARAVYPDLVAGLYSVEEMNDAA